MPRDQRGRRSVSDSDDDAPARKSARTDYARQLRDIARSTGVVLPPAAALPIETKSASAASPRSAAPAAAAAAPAAPKQPEAPKPLFSGLLAAPVTAMTINGDVDTASIADYAAALAADGVTGVFATGTTGESMSLSVSERKRVIEAWVRSGHVKVCAMIGAQSQRDTIELAQHAEAVGATAIAVMLPSFFKPSSVSDVVDYLATIAQAAPKIPMLAYHFPTLTGTPFKLCDILAEAMRRGSVPTLRGAKFTSWDLCDFSASREVKGVTDVIYSIEGNAAGAAFLGATAFIGMQFSVVGPLYSKLLTAASAGDVAQTRKLQALAADFTNNVMHGSVGTSIEKNIAAMKHLVSLRLGFEMGHMRAPGPRLTVTEMQKLRDSMEAFIGRYTAAVKPAAPKTIFNLSGFQGKLNEKILARIAVMSKAIGEPNLLSLFPHLVNGWQRRPIAPETINPAAFIDHTLLKPEGTAEEVSKLCAEAKQHKFYAVCVNGCRVDQCVSELRGTNVKIAAVIGFPLGAGSIKSKAREAKHVVELGATEVDMVMNIGAMKEGDYGLVFDDIRAIVVNSKPGTVKVIFETCLLSEEQIIDASILSVAAGARFVKTSTGFNKGGATPEALDAMLAVVGNEAEVKASGGVRDYATAIQYISAGVTRIGTSSGIAIVQGKTVTGY